MFRMKGLPSMQQHEVDGQTASQAEQESRKLGVIFFNGKLQHESEAHATKL
jgi:hypothetical protein